MTRTAACLAAAFDAPRGALAAARRPAGEARGYWFGYWFSTGVPAAMS